MFTESHDRPAALVDFDFDCKDNFRLAELRKSWELARIWKEDTFLFPPSLLFPPTDAVAETSH